MLLPVCFNVQQYAASKERVVSCCCTHTQPFHHTTPLHLGLHARWRKGGVHQPVLLPSICCFFNPLGSPMPGTWLQGSSASHEAKKAFPGRMYYSTVHSPLSVASSRGTPCTAGLLYYCCLSPVHSLAMVSVVPTIVPHIAIT